MSNFLISLSLSLAAFLAVKAEEKPTPEETIAWLNNKMVGETLRSTTHEGSWVGRYKIEGISLKDTFLEIKEHSHDNNDKNIIANIYTTKIPLPQINSKLTIEKADTKEGFEDDVSKITMQTLDGNETILMSDEDFNDRTGKFLPPKDTKHRKFSIFVKTELAERVAKALAYLAETQGAKGRKEPF